MKDKHKLMDLTDIKQLISERNIKKPILQMDAFVDLFCQQMPSEELRAYPQEELYGSLLSCWHFIQQRKPQEIKIKVYNPDLELDGWQTRHTIIKILVKDMPFIIDSLRIEMHRRQIAIHHLHSAMLPVTREVKGQLDPESLSAEQSAHEQEALIYLEIDRHTESQFLDNLHNSVMSVMQELKLCVDDYNDMLDQVHLITQETEALSFKQERFDQRETLSFLRWLVEDHFTFLGFDEFTFSKQGDRFEVNRPKEKALGILKLFSEDSQDKRLKALSSEVNAFVDSPEVINFFKSGTRSRIHRPAYADYIVIKRFDKAGNIVGGVRFLGLYTSRVYLESPYHFPIVRQKLDKFWQLSGLDPRSHCGKEADSLLARFPRDELILSNVQQIYQNTLGILNINERPQTRIFIRQDGHGKFVSCLVYTPRDRFNTKLRLKIQQILCEFWQAEDVQFNVHFSESILTRLYFVFRLQPENNLDLNRGEIEQKIAYAVKSWSEVLHEELIEAVGEEKGNALHVKYRDAFPTAYMDDFSTKVAVSDILHIEDLQKTPEQGIGMSFYRELEEENEGLLRFKLFTLHGLLPLSDLLPVIENFGLRVIDEHPYTLHFQDKETLSIHNFSIEYLLPDRIDMPYVKQLFQTAFRKVWFAKAENDSFNRLVLGAGIDWRDIAMLRSYARYMKQTQFGISEQYIAETLSRYVPITRLLVQAFQGRFAIRPEWNASHRALVMNEVEKEFYVCLEAVKQLNEDRVLRRFLEMMKATLRTNFFQQDEQGEDKNYLAFKIEPRKISAMPQPTPMFEIFVYSTQMEGVHLRGGKVARGGLRWSDRYEDYRTEVLGLVKAQQVKNAVIVPVGAKGGFVAKNIRPGMNRDEVQQAGIESYKMFISALLDVTDNLIDGEVVPPPQVVRHDDDDVYLVVAADKGTATFSDISNAIALQRNFWLGDAFASGGSIGYDHKKMGITAKGAWVSVQRHFREKQINTQEHPISVVGIGDMAGDVFGNGMLLSECIQLTAAFNHLHIFIDPTPNHEASFVERQRLFNLPGSSWEDYDESLISEGGGVFSRQAKSIPVSKAMQLRFEITEKQLTPQELIRAILKAPVDLIWNGGIGTYIKSSDETNEQVGDKANDGLRVDACDVQAKVIGEGGNLGVTQLARVEFSLAGGACYTDFIDNAAGVDCSDHEVNIKIMLNDLVMAGDLTEKHRNQLFLQQTDAVAHLVLQDNYEQTQAIALAKEESKVRLDEYLSFIKQFEESGKLDRALEYIPDNDQLFDRYNEGLALTQPELSVLISYAKADLKEQLNCDPISQDSFMQHYLERAFPDDLVKQFQLPIHQHKLKNEIIATQLANDIVNTMGITFLSRMQKATGALTTDIAKAFVVASVIHDLQHYKESIYQLDYQVNAQTQEMMLQQLTALIRRTARWFIKNRRQTINIDDEIARFTEDMQQLRERLPSLLQGDALQKLESNKKYYLDHAVPEPLAALIALSDELVSALGVIEVAQQINQTLDYVAKAYFTLSEALSLDWLDNQISLLPVQTAWQEMARVSFREDLDNQLRSLTTSVFNQSTKASEIDLILSNWLDTESNWLDKWHSMLDQIKAYGQIEYPMVSVALKSLEELSQPKL